MYDLAYWFIGCLIGIHLVAFVVGGGGGSIGGGGGPNEDITMSELWPCLNACKNRHCR